MLSKISLLILTFLSFTFAWADEDVFVRERSRINNLIEHGQTSDVLIGDELKKVIIESLNTTQTGKSIVKEMERLSINGFEKLNGKKLKIVWMINRTDAPLAEYTNDAMVSLNATTILGIPNGQIHSSKKMIESFLVHEMTHAIVHDLSTRGLFSPYGPDTKLNEFLAYKIQGQFIEELEKTSVKYDERMGTPVWDQSSMTMIRSLKLLGIDELTTKKTGQDILNDLMLEADTDKEIAQALKLQHFYDFLNNSGDKAQLWKLSEENSLQVQSTLYLYGLIKQDVSDHKFNRFFTYLKNRIPLYADYSNLPDGINSNTDIYKYVLKLTDYLKYSVPEMDLDK